ncbi:GGDEF domain-containing protein [Amorphus orientalis]|uniref:diguanylate cyclase n=1 Tax=Amorphus orientalis TaxID=649198 RepID=A0AAE3VL36_9HYPH|nr:GGDEF domain-containing protein [Amorphus orientalis]MDQ0313893.1 diguanylate cyclase (GGDEF)-like protein [Amorphus orientalis]
MSFDVGTLYAAMVLVFALVGLLLIWAWIQKEGGNALIWWAASFFVSTSGVVLLGDWDVLPDLWSVEVALSLLVLGHGLIWAGVRSFAGRSIPWFGILGGAIVWMIAYQTQEVQGSTDDRVVIMSLLAALYTAVTAWEVARSEAFALRAGRAAFGLLVLHVLLLGLRIPVADVFPLPFRETSVDLHLALLTIEPMLFAVALGYMLLVMTRERMERRDHMAALIDPLTSILNRRGFFEAAGRVRSRSIKHSEPIAALLLDLDHFKRVNDTHGHAAGDEVLRASVARIRETLRTHDVFGRIGGEEFAVVFSEVDETDAQAFAERLRARLAAEPVVWRDVPIEVSVSIGVAVAGASEKRVEALLEDADRALYEAKRRGRNCVVLADTRRRPIDKPAGGPV